jgi:methionine sulfoxide reductase heme-binding subunit
MASDLFWITSRAAGFASLILASLAVSLGLVMSLKLLRKRGPDLLAIHEILSLSALVALVVHGVALLGDTSVRMSVADISVPFASGYQTFWTSTGIIAGWMLIVLGLSYYARRRIGTRRWRELHRWTALAWMLGVAHSLGEGTDAGQLWFLAMLAIVVIPAIALLLRRWWPSARPDRPRSRPSPSSPGPAPPRRSERAAMPTPGV